MTARSEATDAARALRGALRAGTLARALLLGAAVSIAVVAASALVDMLAPVPLGARVTLFIAALLGGLAVAGFGVWRSRGVLSLARVALWVEERFPALEFA